MLVVCRKNLLINEPTGHDSDVKKDLSCIIFLVNVESANSVHSFNGLKPGNVSSESNFMCLLYIFRLFS